MAVVDAGYRFVMVDIDNYGSNSGIGMWKHSIIGQCHIQDDLGLPPRKMLPGYQAAGLMPHVFVGDEAFGIAPNMTRPYPRRQRGMKMAEDQLVFNYRHSRARQIVESTFVILVQRFRVFDRRMYPSDANAIDVTKACVPLHNYLTPPCTEYRAIMGCFNPDDHQYNSQTGALRLLRRIGYHSPQDAVNIRDWFKSYFWSPQGAVPWEMKKISNS